MPTPPPVFATCKILNDEMERSWGENGYRFRNKYRIGGVSRDAGYLGAVAALGGSVTLAPIDFALSLPALSGLGAIAFYDGTTGSKRIGLPNRGDTATAVVNITNTGSLSTLYTMPVYCLQKSAKVVSDSVDSIVVAVDYGEIGLPLLSDDTTNTNTYAWLIGAKINGASIPTQTNFTWNVATTGTETFGSLMQVYYKPGTPTYDFATDGSLAANLASGAVLSQYVNLPSLETISNFQFDCREIVHPSATNPNCRSIEAKISYYNGAVNSVAIWGFPIGTLRLRAIVSDFDVYRDLQITNPDGGTVGTGIINGRTIVRNVLYLFEYRARGWAEVATLKIPATGFEPPDISQPSAGIAAGADHGNGWGQFMPLRKRNFAELLLPDIRAF